MLHIFLRSDSLPKSICLQLFSSLFNRFIITVPLSYFGLEGIFILFFLKGRVKLLLQLLARHLSQSSFKESESTKKHHSVYFCKSKNIRLIKVLSCWIRPLALLVLQSVLIVAH